MANASALFHRLNHVLESRRMSEIRIEALTALTAAVLCFLIIFGSWRRWCTHWFIQKGLMVAYFMSFSLATYTIGLMQSAELKVEVYPIWAVCFLIIFGCSNSITAYSVDEHKQVLWKVSQYIIYVVYVALILYSVADGVSFIVVFVMLVITLVKVYQRMVASMAVASLRPRTRVIADYMDSEHETSGGELAPYDPVSMTGYRYLVRLKPKGHEVFNLEAPRYASSLKDFEVITIDKIWREGGGDDGPIDRDCKDVCLSYALFLLLTRRLFGYSCGESKQQKTHDLVFEGLLRDKDGQMGYERAFKVIETELAFMYDVYFTKYGSMGSWGMTSWTLASVASMLTVMVLTVMRTTGIVPAGGGNGSRVLVAKATVADATITILILAALALLEVVELVIYWASNWGRVHLACKYVRQRELRSGRKPSCCSMSMKTFLRRVTMFSGGKYYWRHQLGQYSLLQSIGRGDPNVCIAQALNFCQRISKIVGLRGFLFGVPAISKKALDPVELTAEVKQSVVLSLKRTGGRLTNGTSSLEDNRCNHLSWACLPVFCYSARSPRDREKDTQTPVILIWHIATCYCEMAMTASPSCSWPDGNTKLYIGVATKLSSYCAYLIVSAPQLLPGNNYDTTCLFNAAAREAVNVLAGAEDKYEAMRNLDESIETIFKSGVKLGKQLEEIEDATLRWKVMADFWAEMMLYVAPSDNAEDHVEQLARGGEFITHLWALLYHAGIVNRDNQHDTVVVELVNQHDTVVVEHVNQHDTVVVELVDGDRHV